MADETPITTDVRRRRPAPTARRGILSALLAFPAAGAAAMVPASTDAPLLAACAEAKRCGHVAYSFVDWPSFPNTRDNDELDQLCVALHDAVDVVSDLPATTLAGARAKAETLIACIQRDVAHFDGASKRAVKAMAQSHEWLAYQLARDLLAITGGAA